MEKTVTITIEGKDVYTIHDASKIIMELDPKQEDYEFRVQAVIKRLIHEAKANTYSKVKFWIEEFSKEFNLENLEIKIEQHRDMRKNFSDEELITWNVGNHRYNQKSN